MRLPDETFCVMIQRVCARLLGCRVADVRVRRSTRQGVILCNGKGWLAVVYVRDREHRRRSKFIFFPSGQGLTP